MKWAFEFKLLGLKFREKESSKSIGVVINEARTKLCLLCLRQVKQNFQGTIINERKKTKSEHKNAYGAHFSLQNAQGTVQ